MATVAQTMLSSVSRPLPLRRRPDLVARQHRYHGQTYWIVKEPVGLNYYRFHEEEFFILNLLDGRTSLEQIKEQFEARFTPQKITYHDLQHFIGMLHRSGLVISHAEGQGRQLKKRRDQKKRRELLAWLSNIFALRWRGVDPERFLNFLYPYTRWFFHRVTVSICLAIALCALLLVLVQWDVFRSRLPTFHEFFGSWKNWVVMAVVMAFAKVLHELGHGLSCKHFKGECHEIGFMLLVFTPALYCNVSDSWMLPNKWHRAAIGAAGMYVEIVLASLATFLWWFTDPATLVNQVCLSLMFICSVSTIIFNGNPLLRFDGYYILMDLLEIPNLRQKSTEVLKRFMVNLCLGIEQPENPFLPKRNRFLFGLYTVASVVYRWVIVLSIVLFLNKVLEPYGLKVIGRIVGLLGLFGLVVQPLWQLGRFFYVPGRMHKVKKHRLLATLAVLAGVAGFIVFVPLPYHVRCSFQVKPRDAVTIYAAVPGQLVEVYVRPGERVRAGDPIARLQNVDLELAVAELEGRLKEVEEQIRLVSQPRPLDDPNRARLPQLEELRQSLQRQLSERQQQLEQLQIRAPADGVVLPVPDRPERPTTEEELPQWSGSLLDPHNAGAWLAPSDAICQIGDPRNLVAELVIDQAHIDLVRLNDPVELMLDAYPGTVRQSHVEKISLPELKVSPLHLAAQLGGEVDTVRDPSGIPRPLNTSYPALAPLKPDPKMPLQVGMRGRAKVYTAWQPLGRRIWRFMARTFHFEL